MIRITSLDIFYKTFKEDFKKMLPFLLKVVGRFMEIEARLKVFDFDKLFLNKTVQISDYNSQVIIITQTFLWKEL